MAGKDFVVKNGIHTVGNTFIANTTALVFNTNVTFSNTTVLRELKHRSLKRTASEVSTGKHLLRVSTVMQYIRSQTR